MGIIFTFIFGVLFGAYNALKVKAFICSLTATADELAKSAETPKVEPKPELYIEQEKKNKHY